MQQVIYQCSQSFAIIRICWKYDLSWQLKAFNAKFAWYSIRKKWLFVTFHAHTHTHTHTHIYIYIYYWPCPRYGYIAALISRLTYQISRSDIPTNRLVNNALWRLVIKYIPNIFISKISSWNIRYISAYLSLRFWESPEHYIWHLQNFP